KLDEEAGVIGSVTGLSQHDSDRIAGIANSVCRQHAPLRLLGAGHRGRRQRWQLLAKLTTSMRREDPRACESAFSLDRTDARMGIRTTDDGHEEYCGAAR